MEKKLLIYTSEKCPSCKRVKAILDKQGIQYEQINMDDKENFMKALMNQVAATPTLQIGDKKLFARNSTTEEIMKFIKEAK